MTLQEFYWLVDHHYVAAQRMEKGYHVTREDQETVRALHRNKKAT